MTIRHTNAADIVQLAAIADATLFPGEMLGPMVTNALKGDGTVWLTALNGQTPVGFCFAAPEEMTENAWNMKALAVAPDQHRAGHGTKLVRALEAHLADLGARVLVVDTASDGEQTAARAFYNGLGYTRAGSIADFWGEGSDKVIFCKAITA